MSASGEYLERQQLIQNIISAASAEVKIEIINEQYPEIIYPLEGMFRHRKLIAIAFESANSADQQEHCLVMFKRINEDIKKVIGL